MNDLAVVVLAGGQSRRMGRDKALLKINGQSLLQHTIQKAQQVATQVLVVGRSRPDIWSPECEDVDWIPDARPGEGPLGGLYSAFQALPHSCDKVLLIACDMPLLSSEALSWLAQQSQNLSGHGLVARHDEQWEPLFAVYRRAVLPLVTSHLAQERRSLHALIGAGDFEIVEAPPWLQPQLANVNTPQEWRSAGLPGGPDANGN